MTAGDTGAPIVGAAVLANSTAGGLAVASGATDGAGNYTLAIPTGIPLSVIVSAYAATGGHYAGAQATLGLAAPGQAKTHAFALNPAFTYAPGLQMISSPFDYSGLSGFPANGGDFAALFGEAGAGQGAPFLQWQPSTGGYVFYPHAPVSTLRPGQGYWTSLPGGSYLHFDGALVPRTGPFGIQLASGWNQIGDPFPAPAPVGSLTDGAGHASGRQRVRDAAPVPLRHGLGYLRRRRRDRCPPALRRLLGLHAQRHDPERPPPRSPIAESTASPLLRAPRPA